MYFFDDFQFLPKNENVLIHAKIKNINAQIGDYLKTSQLILDYLEKFNPKNIIVPTFTHSFTHSGLFNPKKSSSEIGRFSEEVRCSTDPDLRTKDPIFSFIDLKNKYQLKDCIYLYSFNETSIFNNIFNENYVVINIGLTDIVSAQFHAVEYKANVPYRKFRKFKGKIDGEHYVYNFYCRDKNSIHKINRRKVLNDLTNANIVFEKNYNGIIVRYFYVKKFTSFLLKKMNIDPYYLVNDK